MVREHIIAQLRLAGVNIPEEATLQQLCELLGAVMVASLASSRTPPSQQQQQADVSPLPQLQANASPTTTTKAAGKPVHASEKDDEIEQQLEKKLQLLKLKEEIKELEGKAEMEKSVATFEDVAWALPKFSGDGAYAVTKWVQQFEETTNSMQCTHQEKFIYARRMMVGSAALFMRRTRARDWETLKGELIEEFRRVTGAKEALRELEARKWNKEKESLYRYVLVMQELAEDAPISEKELVEYVVDGLEDTSVAASIFFNVNTVAELKQQIPRYEKLMRERRREQRTSAQISQSGRTVRCYNCLRVGHYSSSCKQKKQSVRTCFICGRPSHVKAQCPLRAVAAIPEDDEVDWNMQPL
ncbi:uncharacterized protein [Musca autumnalis]|uniref:uncharacterized protein n=1 Tax=Musca autumnalis TaxID=221902 RepID=UPI003CF1BB8F